MFKQNGSLVDSLDFIKPGKIVLDIKRSSFYWVSIRLSLVKKRTKEFSGKPGSAWHQFISFISCRSHAVRDGIAFCVGNFAAAEGELVGEGMERRRGNGWEDLGH